MLLPLYILLLDQAPLGLLYGVSVRGDILFSHKSNITRIKDKQR